MALTKVTGDFIKDGVLTQAHLHTSHGITTAHIGEGSNLYFTNARVANYLSSNNYVSGTGTNNRLAIWNGTGVIDSDSDFYVDGDTIFTTNLEASGSLNVSGGNITLGGTGRIQGIDTVSANTDAANKLYVDDAVAGIVDSAPSTLDTLNELAAALGDDANFSTTVTNSIGTKMPLAGGTFTGNVSLLDNIILRIGTGNDLELYHNNSSVFSQIRNNTGDLYITNLANDKDIIFQGNDGGSVGTVLTLDMSNSGNATFAGNVDVNGSQITVGTNNSIFAENNLTFKSAGAAFIDHNTVSQSIKFRLSNSSALDVTPLEITPTYLVTTGDMYFADDNKIRLGASSDLQIYHDGDHSYIQDTAGTGDLRIDTNVFRLRSANGGETMITAFEDGAVNLMNNDITRLSTTNTGITVTGNVTASSGTGHFSVVNASAYQLNGTYIMDSSRNLVNIADITAAGDLTADQVITTNNGNGQNYRIGDDAWIGDINLANTFRISGNQNGANGYITFGNSSNDALGRAGTGALTWAGNTIWHAGNDGSGSGLDADLLDGINSGSFLRSDADDSTTGGLRVISGSIASSNTSKGLLFDGNYTNGQYRTRFRKQDVGGGVPLYIDQSGGTANSYTTQARFGTYSGNNYEFEVYGDINATGNLYDGGNAVWHAGNDGSGSGLDADTLDGSHKSDFWVKSGSWYGDLGSHSYTREIGLGMTGGSEFVVLSKNGQGSVLVDGHYMAYEGANGFFGSYNSAYGNLTGIRASAANTLKVMQLDGGNAILEVTQDARAPIFYDLNDTTYFLNPSSSGGNAFKTIGDWRQTTDSWSGEVGGKMQYHANHWYLQAAGYIHFRNASGTNTFYVDQNGVGHVNNYLTGASSLRAPIFYDSNNTNYYADPHSTSNFAALNVGGQPVLTEGNAHVFRYRGSLTSQNWNDYIDGTEAGYNSVLNMSGSNKPPAYTYGIALNMAISSAGKAQLYFPENGSSTNGIYVRTGWNATYRDWKSIALHDVNPQTGGSLYANTFYDSDNTTYYVNPATSSLLKAVQIDTTSNTAGSQFKVYTTTNHQYPQIYSNGSLEAMWNYKNSAAEWYVGLRTTSQLVGTTGFHFYNTSQGQTVGGWDINGHSYSIGSSRAPIFYDSNDTTRYLNPSDGSTSLVTSGKLFVQGGHSTARMHINYAHGSTSSESGALTMWVSEPGITYHSSGIGGNIHVNGQYYGRAYNSGYGVYVRFDKVTGNLEHWTTTGSAGTSGGQGTRRWYNDASGNSFSINSARAPIFYDSNNTGYYLDPHSTSNLNAATFVGTISGQNAYFAQDVAIGFTSGNIGGRLNVKNSAAGQIAAKLQLGSSVNSSSTGVFVNTTASYASSGMFLHFQSNHISGDDNVLICYLDGDIVNKNNSYTQYSDEKLKENIVDATDKLEEVKQIKVRNFNFKGEDLKQIGVVAQELESIFPALVKEREVPGYEEPIKTVKYSVLVPILIKAMQEQQTIIDDLKSRVETLENQ
jgi:hypothetical protein